MIKHIKYTVAAVLLAAGVLSQEATAVPISGSIDFAGAVHVTTVGDTVDVGFFAAPSPGAPVVAGTTLVSQAPSGDYAGVPIGTIVSFTNFTFDKETFTLTPDTIDPVWSFVSGNYRYEFKLQGLDAGSSDYFGSPTAPTISLNGWGIATIYDATTNELYRDPTGGTFYLGGGGVQQTFSFTATSAVPDGGATAALLGCSFLGLAYVRNRFALLKA